MIDSKHKTWNTKSYILHPTSYILHPTSYILTPPSLRLSSRPAESLLEVIVALLMIASASTASLTMISQSKNASTISENKTEAIEIAEDGLESFVMLKNTNWMKFPEKSCWDAVLEESACDKNSGEYLMSDTGPTYTKIILDPLEMRIDFETVGFALVLQEDNSQNLSDMKTYGLFERTEEPNKGFLVAYKDSSQPAETPKYYRMLQLEYLDGTKNLIKATSKVQWFSLGKVQEVTQENIFANY